MFTFLLCRARASRAGAVGPAMARPILSHADGNVGRASSNAEI